MLAGSEQAPVPWVGGKGSDEQGCAVVSLLVRQCGERDRKQEGAGRDDFDSVAPRSHTNSVIMSLSAQCEP